MYHALILSCWHSYYVEEHSGKKEKDEEQNQHLILKQKHSFFKKFLLNGKQK